MFGNWEGFGKADAMKPFGNMFWPTDYTNYLEE
jgi:hypothetical protein